MKYTQSDLNTKVNENETLSEFIRNSEKEFNIAPQLLQIMSDGDFNRYIYFLDDLWCK